MLSERKLTENELEQRKIALKGLLKNKRALVQKYGKDAETVMYGIATKQAKKKIENMNLDKLKEMIQDALIVKEASPFVLAADAAKDAGKKEFEFPKGSGKMHPVTIKKDIEEDYLDVDDTKNNDTGFSGRADYGEEDKALGQEDELEMKGLEEGHGLDQGDIDVLKYMISQLKSGGDLSMDVGARKKMVKVLTFLIKSNIIQDKTKDLSKDKIEEENISLDEVGYNDGEQAVAMHFNQDVVGINNESDFKQYKKGFIQAVVDETQSYALEEMDANDPVLMKLRALASKKDRQEKSKSRISYEDAMDLRLTLSQLEDSRDRLVRDMEQEAEPEGGPIADRYGDELNKLEDRIDSIRKKINDYDMNESIDERVSQIDAILSIDEMIKSIVKEKLTKKSSVEDHIDDFKDSDAPQFKGKSLKKIKQMALASFLSKQGKSVKENMVADKDIEKEIKKLEDENPKGFEKEIKKLKVRQAALKLSKQGKKKVSEGFKVGQKVTYLGHPGEITKVNKEMTGATTYNVSYDKGTGKTKVSNIYNKGGEIKAV